MKDLLFQEDVLPLVCAVFQLVPIAAATCVGFS